MSVDRDTTKGSCVASIGQGRRHRLCDPWYKHHHWEGHHSLCATLGLTHGPGSVPRPGSLWSWTVQRREQENTPPIYVLAVWRGT